MRRFFLDKDTPNDIKFEEVVESLTHLTELPYFIVIETSKKYS